MSQAWVGQARELLTKSSPSGAVAVLGDLGLDKYIFGAVDRVSPEAPVLVLHAEKEDVRLGCAANVVRNLSELGDSMVSSIGVYGVAGDDLAADQLCSKIEALRGLNDVCVLRDSSRPTILKTRFIAGSHHQLLRCDVESSAPVSDSLKSDLKQRMSSSGTRYQTLVIEDYGKGLFTGTWLPEMIQWCQANEVISMIDPNRNTNPMMYAGADLITPNVLEAEILLGRSLKKGASDETAEAAAREIQKKLSIKNVVLKRSAYGMTLLQENGQITHFRAEAKEVFDVTGAGDTVIAVLAACHSLGASLEVSTFLANLAAGIVVGKAGAATVKVAELLERLD